MKQFIYVLTNRSMPGLVKIGKTTVSPSRRMAELHSTGVPTPFDLVFAASVEDCTQSERAAHKALHKKRINQNREFFECTPKAAIEAILPVIDQYQIVFALEALDVKAIERHFEAIREKKAAKQRDIDLAAEKEAYERSNHNAHQRTELTRQLVNAENALRALGVRPMGKQISFPWSFLIWAYYPMPIGWMIWLGTFQVFDGKYPDLGYFCISLIVLGYFSWKKQIEQRDSFLLEDAPFVNANAEVLKISCTLEKLPVSETVFDTKSRSNSNGPQQPGNTKKIIECVRCSQKLRIPVGKNLNVKCPKCGRQFEYDGSLGRQG